MDGVSPAAQNMAIETFLGVMVLLLAMLLIAIVLTPAASGTMATSGPAPGADDALLDWSAAGPDAAQQLRSPAGQELGTQSRTQNQARRGRYQPRHVRGYAAPPQPRQRPPWEEARTPPESR